MIGIIFLVVFLAAMVAIGLWGMKKTSTLQDFFLGGRTIGPWISAFAYGTTYFSAVLFIGFAGKQGWGFGWNALWIAGGNAVLGSLLAWFVLGIRTRRMTQNLDVMTMPELFQERYGAKYLKPAAAIIIFVFLLPYSASVFKGLGHLFEAVFHIPYDMALLIMIGITGVYLVLGGYFAVTLTDFIQGIIMLFGCFVMVYILVDKGGGIANVAKAISENYPQHVPAAKQPSALLIGSLVFMTSFGTWGLPQMVQKFYSVKNEKVIPRAAVITFLFALVIGFSAYFSGAMSHVFFSPATLPKLANGTVNFDSIMPTMLVSNLPELVMAVILLLVLSASMSTLASLVLVSSSAIAIDLYKGHADTKGKKDNSVMLMRFLSALFVVISYFIARFQFGIIVTLMSLSWGCIAGAFMAPYMYSLYWKRTTKWGIGFGMASGLGTMIVLFFLKGAANSPLWASIAMLVPFAVVPAVSLLTKAPDQAIIDKSFAKQS
jgi:SSS family solute:Na+ symporter